jgi:hypothetical protein
MAMIVDGQWKWAATGQFQMMMIDIINDVAQTTADVNRCQPAMFRGMPKPDDQPPDCATEGVRHAQRSLMIHVSAHAKAVFAHIHRHAEQVLESPRTG